MISEIPFFYFVLLLSFITALAKYKTIRLSYFHLSVYYLLMNLIVETYGLVTKAQGKNNFWIYNLSTTAEFGFYYYLFYKANANLRDRRVIQIISMIFFPLCFINIIFIQGINHFHSNTFILGSISLIYLSVSYFKYELRLDEITNPFTKKMFWIATAVLFFYTGTIFNLGLFEFIHIKSIVLEKKLDILLNILNTFLYTAYVISFLFLNEK